jgi:hypothetical protein
MTELRLPDLHALVVLDVSDRQCIHVTYDGKRCEANSSRIRPHGWLCEYHDTLTMRKQERLS